MAAQTTFINSLLEAAFRGGTYTGGVIKMALFKSGMPTTGGVEVTGGGYARQTITFSAAASKQVETSVKAKFTDLPTSTQIIAYGIYSGTTLIYEDVLGSTFQADVTNNELEIGFKFSLGA